MSSYNFFFAGKVLRGRNGSFRKEISATTKHCGLLRFAFSSPVTRPFNKLDLLDREKLERAYKSTLLPMLELAKNLGFSANWRFRHMPSKQQ